MGLKSFLDSKGITAADVTAVSARIETFTRASRVLLDKRERKRQSKDQAAQKYADLGLDKPKELGRGVGLSAVTDGLADKPLPRKARTKILRAVNALLTKKGEPAADMKAVFEGGSPIKPGKKVKAEGAKG